MMIRSVSGNGIGRALAPVTDNYAAAVQHLLHPRLRQTFGAEQYLALKTLFGARRATLRLVRHWASLGGSQTDRLGG